MKKNISVKSTLILLIIILVSLFLFLSSRSVFPSYFFLDNRTVRIFMQNPFFSNDKAYLNTANFFKLLAFNYDSSYLQEQIFSWFLFFAILLILSFKFYVDLSKLKNFILIVFFTIFYGAYFTQMSKELVLLIFIAIILFLIKKNKPNISLLVIFCLLYATFFRSYWFLIFLITVILNFTYKFSKSRITMKFVLLMGLQIFCLQIIYYFIANDYLTNARYDVNQVRIGSVSVNTILVNPLINTSLFTDIFNFVYGLLNLFIPLDGLGSINELAYYIWFWSLIYVIYDKFKLNNYKLNTYFMFFLAFIIVQAFFEPDVGSVLRHQVILVPIVLCLFSEKKMEH